MLPKRMINTMSFINLITSNPLINICFLAWASAQLIKTLLHWFSHGNLNLERLTGAGGMPSSHSSLVVSLTIAMARIEGFDSSSFAMAFAFAAVVMYDAMGVRRAAGEQAKTLNKLITSYQDFWNIIKNQPILDFDDDDDGDEDEIEDMDNDVSGISQDKHGRDRKLKEFLGHTPLEVMAGALLGILIAMIYPL